MRECPPIRDLIFGTGEPVDDELIHQLYEEYQKFLFLFEQVSELYVQQPGSDVRAFLGQLISSRSRPVCHVSWRFMTAIVRNIAASADGDRIIDTVLSAQIADANAPPPAQSNNNSFLRALVACADQDAQQRPPSTDPPGSILDAAMEGNWTVDRISCVTRLRHQLQSTGKDMENHRQSVMRYLGEWTKFHQRAPITSDALLFFILRFATNDGEQILLADLLRDARLPEEVAKHPVVGSYIKVMSPLSLGFDLLPADGKVSQLNRQMMTDGPSDLSQSIANYQVLAAVEPNWAPMMARLAQHVADVVQKKNALVLSKLSSDHWIAENYFLPGNERDPYAESFQREQKHWYICTCGTRCFVVDCGRVVKGSVCPKCSNTLAESMHKPRSGVRQALISDFEPPKGLLNEMDRLSSTTPSFDVRNMSPLLTRCCLLLTSLAMINGALNLRARWPRYLRGEQLAIESLSKFVMIHLGVFSELALPSRQHLAVADQFRTFHLFLNHLLADPNFKLMSTEEDWTLSEKARGAFEKDVGRCLDQ